MGSAGRRTRGRGGAGGAFTNEQILGRVALAAGAISVIAFAMQGGEYGTTDLIRQQRQLVRERAVADSLEAEVKRLQAYKKLVESDPATQERIAREEFGMVRGEREILYRFTEPTASPP